MARWGNVDYRQLVELRDKLEQFQQVDVDAFCSRMAKQLASRLLRRVKQKTPVGQYETITYTKKDGSTVSYNEGMQGGTLRNSWRIKNTVTKQGLVYEIEIYNPMQYASYVEYGHRQTPGRFVPHIGKRLKAGWVTGKFMLRKSEEEIQAMAPRILEKELEKELRRLFNGQ